MSVTVQALNGVKVYNLSSGKTLPQWIAEKRRAALKKDEAYRNRVELLQDFEFSTASQRVKVSPDGEYVIASGTYPPMVRVYELRELSMKFERHMDSDVVQFQILDQDWSKLAFLLADRSIEFHAPYGKHYRTRVPHFGRDLAYDAHSCDLLVGGSGSEIYRINLEEGTFKAPFELSSPGVNCLGIHPVHGLVGCGGEDAVVECWDPRARKRAGMVDVGAVLEARGYSTRATAAGVGVGGRGVECTALRFDDTGMGMAVGTSGGHVALFDLRSTKPLLIKEHQYELPIVDIKYHRGTDNVITTDSKILKIWNKHTGKVFTNIEPGADVADVALVRDPQAADKVGDSGLLLVAGEQRRVMSFYVPDLGPAPRWCSFLDALTDELEETKNASVYEDYKFVTRDELKALNLEHLVGSPLLKSYMHGFFMDMRLYQRVSAVSDPFAYERWRKERIRQKVEEKRATRITRRARLPKVNSHLAQHMLAKNGKPAPTSTVDSDEDGAAAGGAGAGGSTTGAKKSSANPTGDDRFAQLFTNPEFQIDPESDEFAQRYPQGVSRPKDEDVEELFSEVSDDDEGEADGAADTGANEPRMLALSSTAGVRGENTLLGLGGAADEKALEAARRRAAARVAPLGSRVAADEKRRSERAARAGVVRRSGGVTQVTFTPSAKGASKEDLEEMTEQREGYSEEGFAGLVDRARAATGGDDGAPAAARKRARKRGKSAGKRRRTGK